jgi:hypothetical protein
MNCKDWPAKDFDEISSAVNPPLERLCAECAKLDESKNCQSSDEIVP